MRDDEKKVARLVEASNIAAHITARDSINNYVLPFMEDFNQGDSLTDFNSAIILLCSNGISKADETLPEGVGPYDIAYDKRVKAFTAGLDAKTIIALLEYHKLNILLDRY